MNETHARSFAKAISWRMMGTITTSLLILVITRKWALSIEIGVLEFMVKAIAFYFHERLWSRIHWGKIAVHINSPEATQVPE